MLQYLVIVLDDTSVSFCNYPDSGSKEQRLISVEDLNSGILFAFKENLMIQFVYPSYSLPDSYVKIIESVDCSRIKPWDAKDASEKDVIVYDNLDLMLSHDLFQEGNYVLRIEWENLLHNSSSIAHLIESVNRLNIVITNVEAIQEPDFQKYRDFLDKISPCIKKLFIQGKMPQTNVLTDRIFLSKMNNCNAGDSMIALCPDGRYYPCPAFYKEPVSNPYMGLGGPDNAPFSIGDAKNGLSIKNKQLYQLDKAPICSKCDSYQCKRCIWLNRRFTGEVNTPSHEQCVISHIERAASAELLKEIRKHGEFMPEQDIKEISYTDPFYLIHNNNE